ncbi:hypothetical protein ACFW2D_08985 [Streptomyces sp. NPDC058914]|uniref:hypothetical protein n=1 Tax=Streptomyces sp. NPDC058914 TaxID=3346671 RepID=UPI003692932D
MSEPYGGDDAEGRRRRAEAARLREELKALGRSLDAPGGASAETMAERVLQQVLAERLPVPVAEPSGPRARLRAARRWARARRRSMTAVLCGLLAVLALTPPVRAAVSDWFGFGGVEVRYDPSAVPSADAVVPGCGRSVSLREAERRAGFAPLVPKALGTPDAVTVSGLPHERFLVSLCWREPGGTVRLDEFRARLDPSFVKSVPELPEFVPLDGSSADDLSGSALWFARPHLLRFPLVDADGERWTRETRTAGPTLLWTSSGGDGSVTLRLEGVGSKERAVEIAASAASATPAASDGRNRAGGVGTPTGRAVYQK